MQIFLAITAAVLAVLILYILSLKPNRPRLEGFAPFEKVMIAHRGFYDNNSDAPENSLPAFRKAVEAGFGIEMDVQLTKDGKLVVFHDETLKRMCGADRVLTDLTYEELMEYRLAHSDERVPLFRDVFEIFRNKIPAVIEIKPHGDYIRTIEELMKYLDGYDGAYCVESFHPAAVHWFRRHRPDILRGQISTVYSKATKQPWIVKFVATNLMCNFYARPDFISYNFKYKDQFSYRLLRKLYRVENVAWTIQSKEDMRKAEGTFGIFIFDSFDPRKL